MRRLFIAVLVLSLFAACGNGTISSNKPIFTRIDDLGTWLSFQPANTAGSPYIVALNVNDLANTDTILSINDTKYVSLDLSGSTFTSIRDRAFDYCRNLTGVTIPNSVTRIGEQAFYSCSSLTAINVGGNNPAYSSINGVLYNKNKSALLQYPAGKTGSAFTIPNSVTTIGDGAFAYTSLTNVTIPNSVTTIGDSAFSNCYRLTVVTIPNSVTTIGDGAFYFCQELTGVTIGNSVASIGKWAFSICWELTGVAIPNSVTTIGYGAFSSTGLTGFITIPDSVTSIGNWAFAGTRLTAINVGGNNPAYSSIDGVLYNKDKSALLQYPARKTDTAFTIPQSVTDILNAAFLGCESLTNVTIPNNVTSIGEEAFASCRSLAVVAIPNGVPNIGYRTFLVARALPS